MRNLKGRGPEGPGRGCENKIEMNVREEFVKMWTGFRQFSIGIKV
jgi:hypothetical protein